MLHISRWVLNSGGEYRKEEKLQGEYRELLYWPIATCCWGWIKIMCSMRWERKDTKEIENICGPFTKEKMYLYTVEDDAVNTDVDNAHAQVV
jgi:hypothetical protein